MSETVDHLTDLRRDLPDWLRAQTGWPEGAVACACRLAMEAMGAATLPVEGDVALDHGGVHVHVDGCRGHAELTAEVPGAAVHLVAHAGDLLVHVA